MLPTPYALYEYEHAVLEERFKKMLSQMQPNDEFVPVHDMK